MRATEGETAEQTTQRLASSQKLRILIAGIQYQPNQFTRVIEGYGLEAVHVNSDPDANFPRFCDAAIVVSSYTSHARYYAVKESYKLMNKRVWLVGTGFSQIKEDFERWLKDKRGFVLPAELKLVGQLRAPAEWLVRAERKETEQRAEEAKVEAPKRYSEEDRALIKKIVIDGKMSGKSHAQIMTELNSKGPKKQTGGKWSVGDVGNYSSIFSADKLRDAAVRAQSHSKTSVPKAHARVFDPVLLIQQITGAPDLDAMTKVGLIAKVSVGEIKEIEFTESAIVDNCLILERISILRAKDKNPHLTLTKEQAELLLSNLASLNDFVTKGTI